MSQSNSNQSGSNQFNFSEIENKWQTFWAKKQVFKAEENSSKPGDHMLELLFIKE